MIEFNRELIEKILFIIQNNYIKFSEEESNVKYKEVVDAMERFLEPDLSGYPCPYCGEPLAFGKMSVVYCVGCNREIGVTLSVPEMACYKEDWRK